MLIKCTKEELPRVLQAVNPKYPVKVFSNAGDECWFIEKGVPMNVVFGDNVKSYGYHVNILIDRKGRV